MTTEMYNIIGIKDGKDVVLSENISFEKALIISNENEDRYEKIDIQSCHQMLFRSNNVIVIPEANGMLAETKKILSRKSTNKEQAVFLGNFIAHDMNFLEYMHYLLALKKNRQEYCLFVRGKNEHNLLEYINETNNFIGEISDVIELVQSIEKKLDFPLFSLPYEEPDIYNLLKTSLTFFENDKYIISPGGLNMELKRWRESNVVDLVQTPLNFSQTKNTTSKVIVYVDNNPENERQIRGSYSDFNLQNRMIGLKGNCLQRKILTGLILQNNDTFLLTIRRRDKK